MEITKGLYRHYKGDVYEVLGFAKHSESLEKLIVYKSADSENEDDWWVRPVAMFQETVFKDGKELKRFEKL
jgi:hypothetical protein